MKIVKKRCIKCGKIIEYNEDWERENDGNSMMIHNQCWDIDLGRAGYGSRLDNCEIKFVLCDECLAHTINSFRYKEEIFGDTYNYYENSII